MYEPAFHHVLLLDCQHLQSCTLQLMSHRTNENGFVFPAYVLERHQSSVKACFGMGILPEQQQVHILLGLDHECKSISAPLSVDQVRVILFNIRLICQVHDP